MTKNGILLFLNLLMPRVPTYLTVGCIRMLNFKTGVQSELFWFLLH